MVFDCLLLRDMCAVCGFPLSNIVLSNHSKSWPGNFIMGCTGTPNRFRNALLNEVSTRRQVPQKVRATLSNVWGGSA